MHKYFEYKDGDLYWKITNSNVAKAGKKAGCKQKNGYIILMLNKKFYYAHRIIYMMFNGIMPKLIDHIDRNPNNNKIENLREATQTQNTCNRTAQSNSKSGVKGVYWVENRKKWVGRCQYKGISKLKYFENMQQAIEYVRKLREEMHQNFAHH